MRHAWCPVIGLITVLLLHALMVQAKQHSKPKQQFEQQQQKHEDADDIENDVNFDQITTLSTLSIGAFECLRNATLTHCVKLYVLQRMERGRPIKEHQQQQQHSTSLQKDFMQQLFGDETSARPLHGKGRLIETKYMQLSETELNARLRKQFERFFAHRELKLAHLLPGLMVKVIASKNGKVQFSLKHNKAKQPKAQNEARAAAAAATKNDEIDETLNGGTSADVSMMMMGDMAGSMKKPGGGSSSGGGGGGVKKKNKSSSYKSTILQMAVPVMVMPAILMGSFLPFILPVLKMATIMTLLMNNSAFLAALIYAARTHASAQEEQQHISYTHPAYH